MLKKIMYYYSKVDQAKLEILITIPPLVSYNNTSKFKLAILIHPYGPLGGNMYDHLIGVISNRLCLNNYITVRPNLRGSGNSEGKTTWTGETECQDLSDLIKELLKEDGLISKVTKTDSVKLNGDYCEELLILGYSYGSLIASSFNINDFEQIFKNEFGKSALIPKLRTALICYPLGYLWALTLFNSSTFNKYLVDLVNASNQSKTSLFIIYGTLDQFTSKTQYETWINKNFIDKGSNTIIRNVKILTRDGADHFWSKEIDYKWVCDELLLWVNEVLV